jgi:hypothetical protein
VQPEPPGQAVQPPQAPVEQHGIHLLDEARSVPRRPARIDAPHAATDRQHSSLFSCFDLMASAADDSPSRSPSPARTQPRPPVQPPTGGYYDENVGAKIEDGDAEWRQNGAVKLRIRVQQSAREEHGFSSFLQQHINPLLRFAS